MTRLVGEIIARFEKRGFKLVALQQMSPSKVRLQSPQLRTRADHCRSTSRSTTPTSPARVSSRDLSPTVSCLALITSEAELTASAFRPRCRYGLGGS